MPRPTHKGGTYLPALDGLRALAVGLVVLYHLHVPGFSSGLLGVGVFFTLSGFLITSLLLSTWKRTGGLELKKFWLARARRLLPALILVLATSGIAAAIVLPGDLAKYSWQALTALLYVNNWYNIGSSDSYFDRFGGPGPFDHLWSLAIEEQFYLFWPLLLALLLVVLRKRVWITTAILVLAAGSFVLLIGLAEVGFDNTRAYEGTDTRAGGLLLGAALAFWWPARARTVSQNARCVIDVLALSGIATILYLVASTPDGDLSLYTSGILWLSIATVGVLLATVVPETLVATVLALPPLRWIGERSYGIYLWHMPLIAFLPATFRTDSPGATATIVITVTLALSALSWRYVEDPIRRHGLRRAFTTPRDPGDTLMNHFLAWLIALTSRFTAWLEVVQRRVAAGGEVSVPVVPVSVVPVAEGSDAWVVDAGVVAVGDADVDNRVDHSLRQNAGAEVDGEVGGSGADDGVDHSLRHDSDAAVAEGSDTGVDEDVSQGADELEAAEAADLEDAGDVSHGADESDALPEDATTEVLPVVSADVSQGADATGSEREPEPDAGDRADENTTESVGVASVSSSWEVAEPRRPKTRSRGIPSLRRRRRANLGISIALVAALATGVFVGLQALRSGGSETLDTASLVNDLPPITTSKPAGPTVPVAQRRTSCDTVIHVGDSTSIGLESADVLPNSVDRVDSRYRQFGAKTVISDIVGARSSLETVNGEPNAVTAIEGHLARGERGCWVMAMGINDTANIQVGGPGTVDSRIDRLLGPLKGQQVMWPTVITSPLNENPAYSNDAMRGFNQALLRACTRYPNLRIYDWAAEAKPNWFIDGIHYTSLGYTERGYRFAVALASVFPATDEPPNGCLLKSSGVTGVPPSPAPASSPAPAPPPTQAANNPVDRAAGPA